MATAKSAGLASKKEFVYNGGIMVYDRIACDRFQTRTMAVSEKQAQSNIKFQYRKKNGIERFVPITLLGKENTVSRPTA